MQLAAQNLAQVVEALRRQDASGRGAEKRKATRVAVEARVKVLDQRSGREFVAVTVDFSVGGVGLMSCVKFEAGRQLTVSLPRRGGGAFTIVCTVTHARELAEGVWVTGAKFLSFVVVKAPVAGGPEAEALRIQKAILS